LKKSFTTKTRNLLAFNLARDESTIEEGGYPERQAFFRAFVMGFERRFLQRATSDLQSTTDHGLPTTGYEQPATGKGQPATSHLLQPTMDH
jgi:hypothetical protein